jgi:dihydrofolate synthase/folylpolyglutamate synthase
VVLSEERRVTTYPGSVRFLYGLGNETKVIKLGLERIRTLLRALGDPQDSFRSIHIAGTNGKGSTAAMIEAGLRAAGVRTGLYTSPHLIEPTERIRIAGTPVSERQFATAFDRVHRQALALIDADAIDGHPTYFETVTAMAFLIFRDAGIDRAVVEVGLGGRLDATNVIAPELCVITPIDYDHEQWLGSSLEDIAREKAGILKPGVRAVLAPQRDEVMPVFEGRENLIRVADRAIWDLSMDARGSSYRTGNLRIRCPLAGEHQVGNSLTAAVALEQLGVSPDGIAEARWPGRLEHVRNNPDLILDGAHNPAGIRSLAAYIRRFYAGRRIWLIYGAARDKSLAEIAETLAEVVSDIILVPIDSPRSARPEALKPLFPHPRVRAAGPLENSLEMVLGEAAPGDAVFVTGSLFLVGEARRLLTRR